MRSRSRVLFLLLPLLGWGALLATLTRLVHRVDDTGYGFHLALRQAGDLAGMVEENPLSARRVVEGLWKQGLALRSQEGGGEAEFERAERLSLAIADRLSDRSLVSFTEWYRRRGPAGAARVLAVERSLEEAEIHYRTDALAEASRMARKALDDARTIGDRWSELRALHLLGDAAWMRGAPEEARRHYHQLLILAEEQGSRERAAAAINNLAALDEDRGKLRDAADGYRRALELGRAHGLPDVKAFALLYLGHVFHHQGLYERSVGYFQQAEEGFRALGEIELEASAAGNRGASLQGMGKTKEAVAAYRLALALRARSGDRLGQQGTLLHIAELLAESGEQEEALSVLGEILRATRKAADMESLHVRWGALLTAGDLHLSRGRMAAARKAFQEAETLADRRERTLDSAETSWRWARLLLAEGDTAGAVNALRKATDVIEAVRASAVSEEERVRFLAAWRAVYEDLAGVYLRRLDDPQTAFELLERSRSRALLDSLEGGAFLSADQAGEFDIVLPAAAEPESLSRVAESLQPGTMMIHYTVASDWLAVLAVDSQGLRAWTTRDVDEEELSRLTLLFGGDATASFPLREGWTQLYSDAQRSLSLLLLDPIRHLLPEARTLLIVPDDILFSVPWGALRWGDWTRYLSETHELALQASASAYVRLRQRRPSIAVREQALVIANPRAIGSSERPLAEAETEARELARRIPHSRILLGSEASEPVVRRELGRYSIVHFATHARVDTERPLQSSLLLAGERGALEESVLSPVAPDDGVLSGLEVLGIPLRPGALVTLAACETVRGPQRRGEGVVGLARAFLQSGASTVVATLWPVEDRATRELMVRFYEELASGSSAAGALSRAQAEMARGDAGESRRYPYYWAGFVLIGDER